MATSAAADEERLRNPFGDPFQSVTDGLPGCPVPEQPLLSADEYKAQAHERSQRGVSCWLDGRCRLHNSYLYDDEIAPRVRKAIHAAGRFSATSVWALGQRRHVWLKGCVRSSPQMRELADLVSRIDDVEGVHLELMVGAGGPPPYAVSTGGR